MVFHWREKGPPKRTEADRFWWKVHKTTTCWIWRGVLDRDGYGQFGVGRKNLRAHRWAYESVVGPIPEGLEIDHLCRVKSCVNPLHMEPVTKTENIRRARSACP